MGSFPYSTYPHYPQKEKKKAPKKRKEKLQQQKRNKHKNKAFLPHSYTSTLNIKTGHS